MVALLALGAVQALGEIALRSRAVPPAWPVALPPALAARLDAVADDAPLPLPLRVARARAALVRGDLAAASAEADRLPASSSDRAVLDASLARVRGDVALAAREDAGAGDLAGLADDVDALTARGDLTGALAAQRLAIAELARRGVDIDALAQANFRLGRLEQERAYRWTWPYGPERRAHERLAYAAYTEAVALAPLAERYLLAAANQALNLYDDAAATTLFARARRLDPYAVDPIVGEGDVAVQRHDFALARAQLARARAIAPNDASVARLARDIASPPPTPPPAFFR